MPKETKVQVFRLPSKIAFLAGRLNSKLENRERANIMFELTKLAKQHYKKNYQDILHDILELKLVNASREYH